MHELLLLHGALGSADQLIPLENELKGFAKIHRLNFPGHGGNTIPAEPFSIKVFADSVLNFMDQQNLESVNIFGYSMGGYVALYLALVHPEKINSVITLATKFNWDPSIAEKEITLLDPEKITLKIPAFANALMDRHHPADWKLLMKKTAEMLVQMGDQNPIDQTQIALIKTPVLLMVGDRDQMVSLEETNTVCKLLSRGQLAVMPDTPHAIEKTAVKDLATVIRNFLQKF